MTIKNNADKQYRDLIQYILTNGRFKGDRTGVGTKSVFGYQMRFDLSKDFPLITGKFVSFKSVKAENLWFISGSTNNKALNDLGATIWDEWDVVPCSLDVLINRIRLNPEHEAAWLKQTDALSIEMTNLLEERAFNIGDNQMKVKDTYSAKNTISAVELLIHGAFTHTEHSDGYTEHLIKYNQLQHQLYKEAIAFCKEHNIPWSTGDLGPIYSRMWRAWPGSNGVSIDQLMHAIDTLKTNPTSRRIIVSAWNPDVLPVEGHSHEINILHGKQVLPPCHLLFQFYAEELTVNERTTYATETRNPDGSIPETAMQVAALIDEQHTASDEELDVMLTELHNQLGTPKHRLSCQVYIRSNDVFLGTPFNISGYALLTLMVGQVVNMVPGDLVYTIGDAHIYTNHMDQIKQYLEQETFELPTVKLSPDVKAIDMFAMDDIELVGYKHGGKIAAEVAV